jgi:Mu transposase, C-terminal domain
VTRKVDRSGSISFAGWSYRVGNAYRRRQVEVAIVGDTVQISFEGRLVKTHPVRHDRSKEHGAFAKPGGRPRRINAA